MDVDRRAPVTYLRDVRRWTALRAYGAVRFLDCIQGGLEDIEGAIAAGQFGVVAFQARYVALVCLSIHSLAREGELDFVEDSVSFDYFAGLAPEEVETALAIAAEAADLRTDDAAAWFERFRAYVRETERLVGDPPLPVLRSPEGAFGLLGLLRRWSATLAAYHWPEAISTEYWNVNPEDEHAADR